MNFDIRTLSVSISTVVIGSALISTLAWRYATSQRTIIGYWSLSQGLVGAGLVLVVLRNTIPDFFSVIIANACISGGFEHFASGVPFAKGDHQHRSGDDGPGDSGRKPRFTG